MAKKTDAVDEPRSAKGHHDDHEHEFRPRPGLTDEQQAAARSAVGLMADAWHATTRRDRTELARQALKAWPDCADAWVLLGEQAVRSLEEARDAYAKGVAAGERALGPEAFKSPGSAFTDRPDSRPYLRARIGLSKALWALEKREEALEHLRGVLMLAPDDSLKVRHLVGTCLVLLQRFDEADALFATDRFAGDLHAAALYPKALLAFRKSGDAEAARKPLDEAVKVNPHLVGFILEEKSPPRIISEDYEPGTEAEAEFYSADAVDLWKIVPGAADWLATRTGREAGAPKPIRRDDEKVGRNDPCPCGSGKKYKKCCGAALGE